MADAMVERRPTLRFFCHRCLVEFEDVLQDYTCPYCESGFIEQLEADAEGVALSGDDFSDADMSNIDDVSNMDDMSIIGDSDDMHRGTPPMLDDLAFLMSGGRIRGVGTGAGGAGTGGAAGARRHTLMDELVWMIGGARTTAGALTAGAPFVLVGAPGDYVFGGDGLDAVVTQLLGQLEQAGPPPLPRERLAVLPSAPVTPEQAGHACSVCWENFQLGETVSKLECEHVFHSSCITPWLQLHATCPICRRCLLPDPPPERPAAPGDRPASPGDRPAAPGDRPAVPGDRPAAPTDRPAAPTDQPARPNPPARTISSAMDLQNIRISPRLVIRRATGGPLAVRRLPASSDSSASSGPGLWASSSSSSLGSERDRQYNTDMDCD